MICPFYFATVNIDLRLKKDGLRELAEWWSKKALKEFVSVVALSFDVSSLDRLVADCQILINNNRLPTQDENSLREVGMDPELAGTVLDIESSASPQVSSSAELHPAISDNSANDERPDLEELEQERQSERCYNLVAIPELVAGLKSWLQGQSVYSSSYLFNNSHILHNSDRNSPLYPYLSKLRSFISCTQEIANNARDNTNSNSADAIRVLNALSAKIDIEINRVKNSPMKTVNEKIERGRKLLEIAYGDNPLSSVRLCPHHLFRYAAGRKWCPESLRRSLT